MFRLTSYRNLFFSFILFFMEFLYYDGSFLHFFNPLKMLDQTSDLEIEILEADLTDIRIYKRTGLNKLDSYLSNLKIYKEITYFSRFI